MKQKIIFGQKYNPNRVTEITANDLNKLGIKLETMRLKLEEQINKLVSLCIADNSLQQIVIEQNYNNIGQVQEISFVVDLDKIRI